MLHETPKYRGVLRDARPDAAARARIDRVIADLTELENLARDRARAQELTGRIITDLTLAEGLK